MPAPEVATLEAPSDVRLQTCACFESAGVDRKRGTIRDAVILTGETEAIGHGVYVDAAGVKQAASLLLGRSLPAYATHDGLWRGDRLLDQVGIFSGFYLDGDKLRARNFSFLRAFEEHQPAARDMLLELADVQPDQFGLSIVFNGPQVWQTEDGEVPVQFRGERPPQGALREMPVQRFSRIESADFVKSPAANPAGLFSQPVDAPGKDMEDVKDTEDGEDGQAALSEPVNTPAPELSPEAAVTPAPVDQKIFAALQSDFAAARDAWAEERKQLQADIDEARASAEEFAAALESSQAEVETLGANVAKLEQQLSVAQSLSAARLGVEAAAAVPTQDGDEVTPANFWSRYDAIKDSREQTAFYRRHQGIADKARRA